MAAREAIDLTFTDSDEDVESPSAAAAREAAQRQKIMDFARAKRSRCEVDVPPTDSMQQQGSQPQQDPASTPAAAAGETASTAAAAAGAGAGFGNADLRALHAARMRRLNQQAPQQPAAGHDSSSSPDVSKGRRRRSPVRPSGSQGSAGAAAAAGTSSRGQSAAEAAATARAGTAEQQQAAGGGGSSSRPQVSLLTYNVWFREDVALSARLRGIADIISDAGYPTFVCLQEVTPLIQQLFAATPWWQQYTCSPAPLGAPYYTLLLVNKAAAPSVTSSSFEEVDFDNSCMGRSLRVATVSVGSRKLLVATSHLESPIPPTQWYSKERQQQMRFSLAQLDKAPYGNVLFAGDMNWTDSRDGPPPLPPGWVDAWSALHPGDPGFTYDCRSNPMLPYKSNPGLRLDRVFTRLSDYRLGSISILGQQQLRGATYTHTFRNGGSKQLPVLPSDHFGLLLRLEEGW